MGSTRAPFVPGDGVDASYLDADRSVSERVEILLAQMTVEEKAGLFFHDMIAMGPDGALSEGDAEFALASNREYVVGRHMNHFNLLTGGDAEAMATWNNNIQELARSTRLGIPVTISTDPRNSYSDNPLAGLLAGAFSVWPEALGLAATRDAALVRQFADVARREYAAVGIRVALHPQVDLATEPRWARQLDTFGEDAELTSRLVAEYVGGFQGETFGPGSVSTMTKHFPGGGPQKDGEDPHFAYGREQVYPGGRFDLHLQPFRAAIAAGTRQMMPYYGMPVGTEYDEVGFGFNRSIITGLLRNELGFDGIVCTDWGLISDSAVDGEPLPARSWGVEHLSERERLSMALRAGVDQFGGESRTDLLVELLHSGEVSAQRIDESARRLLREKFELGLFDDPFVDPAAAREIVGSDEFRAAGMAAQRASIVLLSNTGTAASSTLPLPRGMRIYVEGVERAVAQQYGEVVDTLDSADAAIVRLHAPYEKRATAFENYFHAGSLDFDESTIAHVRALAEQVPTIVDVFLDRPAILGPIVDAAHAVVVNFGAHASAVLDVLTGAYRPTGRLPFDIPSSMAAIVESRPDVPFDTESPRFRFGDGLSYA